MKKLILLVMAIAFILVASSCKKEEIVANYDRLSVGLLEVNTTYIISGMTKITFAVPSNSNVPNDATISFLAGENRIYGQNITATVGFPKDIVVEKNWKYIEFSSYKTEMVEILSIE